MESSEFDDGDAASQVATEYVLPLDVVKGTRQDLEQIANPATGHASAPDRRHWDAVTWPERCLESERRFGQKYARLFPLIFDARLDSPNGQVQTMRGPGRLLQVAAESVTVLLHDGPRDKVTYLKP
jgi:hypothetical protein